MNKQEILEEYLKSATENGIQQHSPEWLEAKKTVIGGSQMSTLIGVNPYETQRGILEGKFGIKNDDFGQAKMCWGNTFEDLIKEYTEIKFNTKIIGDNVFIPLTKSSRINRIDDLHGRIAYSPDGLGVVNDEIVLFEFKAPYSRRTDPTKVPEYYLPQVYTGMDVIDVCDYSLFIEAVFRVCAYDQLTASKLHAEYPSREPVSKNTGKPYCVGMMVIYGPEEFMYGNWPYPDFIPENDLVDLDDEQLDKIIVGLHTGIHKVRYSKVSVENTVDAVEEIFDELLSVADEPPVPVNIKGDRLVPYGTLCWKLMEYRIKRVDRDAGFIDRHAETVIKYTNVARQLNQASSRKEKIKILDEVYPAFDDFDQWE